MAGLRDVRDWSNYESLIPRPSHSKAGKSVDASYPTIPKVRTMLRAEGILLQCVPSNERFIPNMLVYPKYG
eukprot:1362697-Pyramimonas_sp.AAC.1